MHLHPNCNVRRFLQDAFENLHARGIQVKFHRSKRIRVGRGLHARGYFDGKTLAVARKCKEWVAIFIHEYCHFLQMIENQKDYVQFEKSNYHENLFDDWITGKYTNEKQFNRTIEKILRMEIDCEKRSVSLITEYNLPIDVVDYIQESHMVFCLYHVIMLHKLKDTPAIRLKLKKKVKKDMPATLSMKFAKKAPKHLIKKMLLQYE
jgi:hypothetical protein